jgi:hypothetical protein
MKICLGDKMLPKEKRTNGNIWELAKYVVILVAIHGSNFPIQSYK